ncbi:MAG: DUF6489 family protein [Geminicoccaceae bacterium]
MKITIDIDCTPQEVRTFFGLPDLEPMQNALLAKAEERLTEYLEARDPEALLKLWFPGGLGQMQERLWKQLLGGLGPASSERGKSKPPR